MSCKYIGTGEALHDGKRWTVKADHYLCEKCGARYWEVPAMQKPIKKYDCWDCDKPKKLSWWQKIKELIGGEG